MQKALRHYKTPQGKNYFFKWMEGLGDSITRHRIHRRLDLLAEGHYGDHAHLGEGVYELRLMFGSGYRIYFAEEGDIVIILLCGGDKSTQGADIKLAKKCWNEWRERWTNIKNLS